VLSLSKHEAHHSVPFDKLRANGYRARRLFVLSLSKHEAWDLDR
jgi:hypothetical protein